MRQHFYIIISFTAGLIANLLVVANFAAAKEQLDLSTLKVPEGFSITLYAEDVVGARSMTRSPSGVLYVGTFAKGFSNILDKVYAVIDSDGDHQSDQVITLLEGLHAPNGVAFRDGDLYVAEISRVLRYRNIEQDLHNPPEPEIVIDNLPEEFHHGWKFIRFSPKGQLYFPVGAPCNICDKGAEGYANIQRINDDGSAQEIYAEGIRNSVGFDWHPLTGELWFTDNGGDALGDDQPSDELNHAPVSGLHFGYPYCHQGDILDPEFGEGKNCSDHQPPAVKLGPHVAALGFRFYTGTQFPDKYVNQPVIALHGSWNRTPEAGHTGYKVVSPHFEGSKMTQYETLVEGWLQADNTYWGRPVDIEPLPDGSLLISDDHADVIYRLSYKAD